MIRNNVKESWGLLYWENKIKSLWINFKIKIFNNGQCEIWNKTHFFVIIFRFFGLGLDCLNYSDESSYIELSS